MYIHMHAHVRTWIHAYIHKYIIHGQHQSLELWYIHICVSDMSGQCAVNNRCNKLPYTVHPL